MAAPRILLIGFLLVATGCVQHARYTVETDEQFVNIPVTPAARFEYPPAQPAVKNAVLDELETKEYRVRDLALKSVGENGQPGNRVAGRYFESKVQGKKPLVIVLPVWGSYTYPSEKTSLALRRRSDGNMHVLMIDGEKYLFEWERLHNAPDEAAFWTLMEHMVGRIATTVIDIRRLLDWAETRPEIDADRIAIVGFSMSAYISSLAVANEPRLSAGVFIMGAAHPDRLMVSCPGRLETLETIALDRFGWTEEEYFAGLTPYFEGLDPVDYAGRVDPRSVLIVDAAKDDCMPLDARDALWEAMNRPERISFSYTHKRAFLSMTPLGLNYMRGEVYRFLEERFESINPL